MRFRYWTLALVVGLAACGSGEDGDPAGNGANPAEAANAAAENATAEAGTGETAPCPFRQTREWVGSVERGHVRINGYVDVTMAGFRPALSEREGGAAGTLALDLAFAPAPNEPINDHARFERTGAPSYRRAEIWCGGERIESFDMTVVD